MLFKVVTTIVVIVAVLAAPTPDPRGESNGIAIPLTKHSNTDAIKFHVISDNAKIIRDMKGFERDTGTPHLSAVKRDGSPQSSGAGVDLKPSKNQVWYATISIGTPPKSFTVLVDTGSSDLFVPASTGDENYGSHPDLWDPASSQTAKALDEYFEKIFADGVIVDGKQYMDNVTIGGFTVDIQTIGAATSYSSRMEMSEFPLDATLGLAFPSLSDFHGQTPLFHTLFNEGKLPQPVFSIKLTTSGGELYVGGMNKALYIDSTLAFTPVTKPELWELKIDSIQVSDKTVLTDVPAIIDTGSNFVFGDSSRVLALHQAYGGKAFGDRYYTLTFTIGGKPFLIPAYVLNKGRVAFGSRDCFSGIMTLQKDYDFWSIGTIFLQRFYTVFDFGSDPPRVGFAKLARIPLKE